MLGPTALVISAQLYEVYGCYIKGDRRPLRNGKPVKM